MDQVDKFFDSIPWDQLKNTSTGAPISEECKTFLDSFLRKKSTNQKAEATAAATLPSQIKAKITAETAKPCLEKLQFPRFSSLTEADHALYVSTRQSTQLTSQSLQILQRLHSLVVAEQKEFNEWLAKVTAGQPPLVNKALMQLGSSLLAAKQSDALSRLSSDALSLHKELPMKRPATSEIHLRPIQHLCSSGRVASYQEVNEEANFNLQPELVGSKAFSQIFARDDHVAEGLASKHSADFILSPAVVFALINSSGKELDLPLTVKSIQDADGKRQKLFVFDKPLPANNLDAHKKMTWAAKKAAKKTLLSYKEKYFDFSKMRVEQCKSDFVQDLKDYSAAKSGLADSNHVYSLWCLEHTSPSKTADTAWGRQGCPIRLLVRSQCHGFIEGGPSEPPRFVHMGVKLERKPDYGAEALELGEITRDWVSMVLRPEALLIRARVDVKSLKVIQLERKDLKAVTKEARSKNVDAAAAFGALHSLLSEMKILEEGKFILRINPKGAVVHVYGLPMPNHATVSLSTDYKNRECGQLDELMHGIQIDPEVFTPLCLKNQRIPATFIPRKVSMRPAKIINQKRKKK